MASFLLKNGKFATKNYVGFYTIGHPTISPEVDPTTGEVELTMYDQVIGATNTVKFYSNTTIDETTNSLVFN